MKTDASNVELTAYSLLSAEPTASGRISLGVKMDEAQIFVAIDTLLDAGGPQKRAERIAQLLENELSGMHA